MGFYVANIFLRECCQDWRKCFRFFFCFFFCTIVTGLLSEGDVWITRPDLHHPATSNLHRVPLRERTLILSRGLLQNKDPLSLSLSQ